jgi:RNA polymerase sigma-70 factor (ECF subfamily)
MVRAWPRHPGVEHFETVKPEPSPDVVRRLVAGHRDFLSFLERRVESRAVAEDILQEAFVRGLERADEIASETAVAWFYRTLRNAVIDHYRRRGSSGRALERFADELRLHEEPTSELAGPICGCVKDLAETLKPEYADAIRRIEIDGLSVKDYAAETGISANNAGVRVFRAREALKKQVAACCGTCAEHGCVECTCKSCD